MKAQEIMTKNVITIKKDLTVMESLKVLALNHISGVPVVDEDNKVVGIFTEGDVVMHDDEMHPITYFSFLTDVEEKRNNLMYDQAENLIKKKVSTVMTKNVITAKEDASFESLAKLMADKNINRVPIVDAEDKIVGIVSRSDMIQNYMKILGN